MKLDSENKFIIPDDENLILITEMEFEYGMLVNKTIAMKGIKFEVDYDENSITNRGKVEVVTSFNVEGIYEIKDGE